MGCGPRGMYRVALNYTHHRVIATASEASPASLRPRAKPPAYIPPVIATASKTADSSSPTQFYPPPRLHSPRHCDRARSEAGSNPEKNNAAPL